MATKSLQPVKGPIRSKTTKSPTKVKRPSTPAATIPRPTIKRFDNGNDNIGINIIADANGVSTDIDAGGRLLVGQKEAREMLGIGRSTMAALVGTGTIKSVLIKRRRLIPVGELKRVARQGCV
jgi:hypothetical protein